MLRVGCPAPGMAAEVDGVSRAAAAVVVVETRMGLNPALRDSGSICKPSPVTETQL